MNRKIAIVLCLILLVGLLALPAYAEDSKTTTEEIEMTEITTYGEDIEMTEITTYGEDIEMSQIETFGEESSAEASASEETGFFAWLKRIWQAILSFFGL